MPSDKRTSELDAPGAQKVALGLEFCLPASLADSPRYQSAAADGAGLRERDHIGVRVHLLDVERARVHHTQTRHTHVAAADI